MPVVKPKPEEDLLHFARRNKVCVDDLKACSENSEILAARSTGVLFEGDEIFVPEEVVPSTTVESGKTHVLVYAPPERLLDLVLHDDDGSPIDIDYTLDPIEYDDTASGDEPKKIHGYAYRGMVRHWLPAATRKVTLVLYGREDDPIELSVGRLDPVSTTRGMRARLQMLGFYLGDLQEKSHDFDLFEAISVFQRRHGLPVTGHADPETRAELAKVCGG